MSGVNVIVKKRSWDRNLGLTPFGQASLLPSLVELASLRSWFMTTNRNDRRREAHSPWNRDFLICWKSLQQHRLYTARLGILWTVKDRLWTGTQMLFWFYLLVQNVNFNKYSKARRWTLRWTEINIMFIQHERVVCTDEDTSLRTGSPVKFFKAEIASEASATYASEASRAGRTALSPGHARLASLANFSFRAS